MKTVIMAGGRGTRISDLFPDIPKPLIPIEGVPVLERELISLRDQGFTDIILTVSYRADQIIQYFKDGTALGMHISYFRETVPLGNAGALHKLGLTDDFLLINGDAVFDIDFNRMANYHRSKGGLATILTHPNSHPYDSGIIFADSNNAVVSWLSKEDERPEWFRNRVNAGIHIINPVILPETGSSRVDLDRQVLKPLCGTGKMFCYDSPEYIKDMGTPERYQQVKRDFRNGLVHERNLRHKQKAIFLDRDGTINKYVGFLRNIDDFELLPKSADAIREINKSGYLAIVVTNQPVIARGEVTPGELQNIHNKMETLLGKERAYLDGIYYCPHHPNGGYPGEVPELKIDCGCRKPKPGMLLQAAEDFNIDLSESWMIGDGENDVLAGRNAGCHTALIGMENFGQEITARNLMECWREIWETVSKLS